MEYKTSEQFSRSGELVFPPRGPVLSQIERLRRWIALLEAGPVRHLRTLYETEYEDPEVRDAMRQDNSPLSVAFADPVLRGEGLRDDTYGEAKKLFGLSDRQLHYLVCYCHHGGRVSTQRAARILRAVVRRALLRRAFTKLRLAG
jgi:hypothetical protein